LGKARRRAAKIRELTTSIVAHKYRIRHELERGRHFHDFDSREDSPLMGADCYSSAGPEKLEEFPSRRAVEPKENPFDFRD
jgi:hypothetical protein